RSSSGCSWPPSIGRRRWGSTGGRATPRSRAAAVTSRPRTARCAIGSSSWRQAMDTAREDRIARLSAALGELADEDLPALIAEARAGAREKARALLEAAFVDALLDRAAAPRPAGGGSGGEGWWVYGVIAARDADRVPSGLEGVEPGSEVEAV